MAQPHESKNGILAKIPGDLIARGSQTLPRPADGQPEERHVVLDAGHLGRVRITYRLSRSQHHKSRNWFWTACHADVE
ncbi:hypothetical protein [Variovorax sp. E3]|uniref:hypothetical protein n=1 Tax=Variovorax sp. E3 TaxID=1914993 RepID=UPI0018DDDEB8|nr:hypothetical protein [Variovorax sp. E3]